MKRINILIVLVSVILSVPFFAQALSITDFLAALSNITGQLAIVTSSTTTTTATTVGVPANCAGITFTRTLVVGSSGQDVKCLQTLLNMDPATRVATTGAGSPGYETIYFAKKTLTAVNKYQTQLGIATSKSVGILVNNALNARLADLAGLGTTFKINITTSNGTVTKVPNQPSYLPGVSVKLTERPNTGYKFIGWMGDAKGLTNPVTIIMDANKNVSATFVTTATVTYTLNTTCANGSVTRSPDRALYVSGELVNLTASPNPGYSFKEWTVDYLSTSPSITVTMNRNKTVTANFVTVAPNTYSLTINSANGTVAKNPDAASYTSGTPVILTATANPGYSFSTWGGDTSGATYPSGNQIRIIMDSNKTITANYSLNTVSYTLTVIVGAGGTVAQSPIGTSFPAGSTVNLTANPNTGYSFDRWTVDYSSQNPQIAVTMDRNKTINAAFIPNSVYYNLNLNAGTGGTATKSPNQTSYQAGSPVRLTASPNTGYNFYGWTGSISGGTNPYDLTMDSDKTISATFTAVPPPPPPSADLHLGKGCTTVYFIDKDCDGYGAGVRSSGTYADLFAAGDKQDADDNDPTVYTAEQGINKYGNMQAFLRHLGYSANNIYYVSTTGSDSTGQVNNPDKPYAAPTYTCDSAAGAAARLAKPGDAIIYKSGFYDNTITFRCPAGTSSSPVLIMAYPGQRVVLKAIGFAVSAPYLTLDGFVIGGDTYDSSIYKGRLIAGDTDDHNVTLRNLEVRNGFRWGAHLMNVNYFTIEDSYFHNSTEHNLYLGTSSSGYVSTGNVVRNNLFGPHNSLQGYNAGAGVGNVHNNGPMTGTVYDGNIIWGSYYGTGLDFQAGAAGNAVVKNNLVFDNARTPLLITWDGGTVVGTNNNFSIINNTFMLGDKSANGTGAAGYTAVRIKASVTYPITSAIMRNNIMVGYDTPSVFLEGGDEVSTLRNTIFENNLIYNFPNAMTNSFKIGGTSYSLSQTQSQYSNVRNNIYRDPLFKDVNLGYYNQPDRFKFDLQSTNSPAYNEGVSTGAPTYDLRGKNRDSIPDAGCYEY